MDPADKINIIFDEHKRLFKEGVIVWGHIIQANAHLFDSNDDHDCPAETVYSLSSNESANPEDLERIAHKLFSLKGRRPVRDDLRMIANYLTNESIRVFGFPVPADLAKRRNCRISTIMVFRKHLPVPFLNNTFFPLLVSPSNPYVAMILPSRYWTSPILSLWTTQGVIHP
ncbi:MAG: hypothetical protein R3C11_27905 [Planctomycetaceae bacterium]